MLTAAVTRLAGPDGQITEELINRYRRIAQGGVGSMVVEAAVVQPSRSSHNLRISDDSWIAPLKRLVSELRDEKPDLSVGLQIMHFLKIARSGWRQRVEDLTLEEIEAIPEMFAAGAARVQAAGFDFVEIHMAHFTTLASFLSASNQREDDYGGDLTGRIKLPLRVVRTARKMIGPEYPLGVRINGEDFTKNGNTISQSRRIALIMAGEGINYLSVSAGERFEDALPPPEGEPPRPGTGYSGSRMSPRWWSPDGTQVHLAEEIRRSLRRVGHGLPVVTAGKIRTPQLAEEIIVHGRADIVGLARGLFADPDWPEKARYGREDDIVVCAACGYCSESDDRMETVRCIQWPQGALNAPRPWRLLPPCQIACPAGVNVRGYIDLGLQGKFIQAVELIKRKIPLIGVICRVCPEFCKRKCNRAQLDEPVAINRIKRLIVDLADIDSQIIEAPPQTKQQRVAVVGSGPAGLSAAYYLVEKGYGVTVFEALPVAGGMLAVGMTEKHLPRRVVQTEINNLIRFGVEILLNQPLGPEGLSLNDLFADGYQTIFLATGTPRRRKMTMPEDPSREVIIPHLAFLDSQEYGLNAKGAIEVDPYSLATRKNRVFAGGDLVLGPATVIQAINQGRRAADSIDRLLSGQSKPRPTPDADAITFDQIDLTHFRRRPSLHKGSPESKALGIKPGLSPEMELFGESERCFRCGMFPKLD
jgi:2,4-dienoyl-CoA reductase-like NADH-dependent reductase (Old Yellow Enzyme family)